MLNVKYAFALFLSFKIAGVLWSVPEDLDVFIDFENTTGEGDFVIGQSPNSVRFIGFTLQSTNDPNLAHSGSKALVLIPGNEGIIKFERGVNLLQFYAVETTRQGGHAAIEELTIERGVIRSALSVKLSGGSRCPDRHYLQNTESLSG